ncbi:MAG: hypothetical protein P3X22_002795 [Thermoprotei archaeon]|nr:hypothetical protein [Thermoprotei archaeon]
MRAALTLALILAFTFRAFYAIYSGEPYYVDSWPVIAGARTFSSNVEARIFDDNFYDGYNNKWPLAIITGGVYSIITGLDPIFSGAFMGPLLGSFAILIFYIIASRLSEGSKASLSTIIAASAATLFAFEGGFTKEVSARPLFLILIFALIHPKGAPLIPFTVLALTLAHHISSVAALAATIGLLACNAAYNLARGFEPLNPKRIMLTIILQTLAISTHYVALAPSFWKTAIKVEDIVTASMIMATSISIPVIAWLSTQKPRWPHRITFSTVIGAGVASMTVLAIAAPTTPQTPPLGPYMLLYAAPLALSPAFAATIGASGAQAVVVAGWLSGVGGLMAYSAFSGDPMASSAIHRLINYELYAALLGYTTCPQTLLAAQTLVALAPAPIVTLNIAERRDPYFHFNVYGRDEIVALKLASEKAETVAGDSKVEYLSYMYRVNVKHPPLKLSDLKEPLVIHRENWAKGFWVSGFTYGDPEEIKALKWKWSLVYDGVTTIVLRG